MSWASARQRGSQPRDGRMGDVVAAADLGQCLASITPRTGFRDLVLCQLGLPAEPDTPGHGSSPPLASPGQDQAALELCQAS
jgi:hypothetical protein